MRWIAGAYFVHTDRFISTGNMVDTGTGVFPVYREPSLTGNNPQATFLADSQDNDAWAVFADVTFEISDQLELDAAVRYDEDKRENTTETPDGSCRSARRPRFTRPGAQAHLERDAAQVTLRYKPTDDITLYGGWSRGFRSGGFNQTGVGAVAGRERHRRRQRPVRGRSRRHLRSRRQGRSSLDRRLNAGAEPVQHRIEERLLLRVPGGQLDPEPRQPRRGLQGRRARAQLRSVTDNLELYASFGYTDSEITGHGGPDASIGNEAPLVSRQHAATSARSIASRCRRAWTLAFRADYQHIGRTWWEPVQHAPRATRSISSTCASALEGDSWARHGLVARI